MPTSTRPAAEYVAAIGIKLGGQHAEIVVNGRTLEHTLLTAMLLTHFEIFHLQYDAQTLYEE